jgi:7-carboxy-7-deazaguanine synthase
MSQLSVSELFGPTIQGEGPCAGRLAIFIRLGGCNLACSWCDTPYSWDGTRYDLRTEITKMPVNEILEWVAARDGIVVITGGEPLLQSNTSAFRDLLFGLNANHREVHLESNGTIAPNLVVLSSFGTIVLSPKLPNAGDHRQLKTSPVLNPAWRELGAKYQVHLKFVCETRADVALAAKYAFDAGWDAARVWAMPQATSKRDLDRLWPEIVGAAAELGINASTRLQILTWGNLRGH